MLAVRLRTLDLAGRTMETFCTCALARGGAAVAIAHRPAVCGAGGLAGLATVCGRAFTRATVCIAEADA